MSLALFHTAFARELRLAAGNAGETALPLLFFLLVLTLFPFALGTDETRLAAFAPSAIWMSALLSLLTGLPRWFQDDEADGTLSLLMLSPLPAELFAMAHACARVLLIVVPLLLALPVASLFFALPQERILPLACSLAVGMPALILLAQMLAALALGAGRGAFLRFLLVAPFAVPILILGASAGSAASVAEMTRGGAIQLLSGYFLALLALSPWVTGLLLRLAARRE